MKIQNYSAIIAIASAVFFNYAEQSSCAQLPVTNLALIPAGAFQMGDTLNDGETNELPAHAVYVSAFYLDKYEVTKALWDEVKAWAISRGYGFDNAGAGKAQNHPVQMINWYDAVKWCNARSEKEGRIPAYYTGAAQTAVYRAGPVNVQNDWVKWDTGYRLPTEAEREKAARGGASGHRFPWSDADTITHSRANYYSTNYYGYDISPTRGYHPNFRSGAAPYTSPVGYFAPNGYGLYDLAGNVWEWTWDWYGLYSSGSRVDPRGPASGTVRGFRGGGWHIYAIYCRAAFRYNDSYPTGKGNAVGFRTVLPAVFDKWAETIVNNPPPAKPTYTDPPTNSPGKDSLIVVTHGWRPIWEINPDVQWLDEMTNAIALYLSTNGLSNWEVVAYKWPFMSWTPLPGEALNYGKNIGGNLGRRLATQNRSHIHFIAKSAGAGLIQAATEMIKNPIKGSPTTVIHETFLDPYIGSDYAGLTSYGKDANWSDHYFAHDKLTGGSFLPFTELPLVYAYNVNVTFLDLNKGIDNYYSSTADPYLMANCFRTVSSHDWPRQFYSETISNGLVQGSEGFGFPLSKEGGNWDYATNHYAVRGNPPRLLGNADPPCFGSVAVPVFISPVIDFNGNLHIGSPGNTVEVSSNRVILKVEGLLLAQEAREEPSSIQSNAWLAVSLTVTDLINFVSFDAEFLSQNGADSLLAVYWETNLIGSLHEAVTLPGLRHYHYDLPETATFGAFILGFRLDSFTNLASTVVITNVALGFVGIKEPFSLSVVGVNTNGGQIFRLTGPPNHNYAVQASTNLVDWTTMAILVNTNGAVNFTDSEQTNSTSRFYRAFGY